MTKSQNKETVSLFGIEIENKKYDTKALVSLLKEKFDELETVGHISYFVQAMKQKKCSQKNLNLCVVLWVLVVCYSCYIRMLQNLVYLNQIFQHHIFDKSL